MGTFVHLDPLLPVLVLGLLITVIIALALRMMRQLYVTAYLITGMLLGPAGIGMIKDRHLLDHLGTIGVILLLFFIGMETSPANLVRRWRIPVLGTLLQVVFGFLAVWGLGWWLGWPIARILLLAFVITLSSTAVVLKILEEKAILSASIGQDVLGVLLVQDLLVIPMLLVLSLTAGRETVSGTEIMLQGLGAALFFLILVWLAKNPRLHLPLGYWIRQDRELQVFTALLLCLGLAVLTGVLGLSTALGAFLGGMLVGTARETQWVHRSLAPFHTIFIALFFMSIGMFIDLRFIRGQLMEIAFLVGAVLIFNTLFNAIIFRFFGHRWQESLYAGALLAQIGEFSFVLAALGYQMQVIHASAYQLILSVIALSLLIAPVWVALFAVLTGCNRLGRKNLTGLDRGGTA